MTEKKATRLASLLLALRRRQAGMALLQYNKGSKVHKKQMAFHAHPSRNRWVFGGNRTGKTECGAVEAVWHALGTHPFFPAARPTTGWVVSPTLEVQRDVAQKKILQYLDPSAIERVVMRRGSAGDPAGGVIDYIAVRCAGGGLSRIGFKSAEMGRTAFQGTSLDWVWLDEEPPQDIYRECQLRLLDRGGRLWATMTPLMGQTWVYDEIVCNPQDDPELWSIRMSWADNPFLPAAEVARMERALGGADKASRRDGHFGVGGGLVYPEFDRTLHVIEPFDLPHEWYETLSIDPGLQNPTACHWYARDPEGTVYVIAEHYQSGWTVRRHAQAILAVCEELGWPRESGKIRAIFDPAVHQRTLSSERSAGELFAECGIQPDTRTRKERFAGIQKVRELLLTRPAPDAERWPDGKPGLLVFATCHEWIREISGYRYAPGTETPQKRDDHAMDALRYFVMATPTSRAEPKPQKSLIQQDLERLTRRTKGTAAF